MSRKKGVSLSAILLILLVIPTNSFGTVPATDRKVGKPYKEVRLPRPAPTLEERMINVSHAVLLGTLAYGALHPLAVTDAILSNDMWQIEASDPTRYTLASSVFAGLLALAVPSVRHLADKYMGTALGLVARTFLLDHRWPDPDEFLYVRYEPINQNAR